MTRATLYVLTLVLGTLCVLFAIRTFELVAVGAGSPTILGGVVIRAVLSVICGVGAYKFLIKARLS